MSARAEIAGSRTRSPNRIVGGLKDRLRGPGGCYNIGNAVGLSVGLLLQVQNANEGGGHTFVTSLAAYFVGDWAALALTLATIVFFWSGEEYHQAWATTDAPDRHRIRRGDLLSGIGATFLGVGLLMVGDPLLAATSGLLHAAGKFGSALDLRLIGVEGRWKQRAGDMFRWAVVASRFPAILIGLLSVISTLAVPGGTAVAALLMPVTLIVCYVLWTIADLMLLSPSRG